MALALTLNVIFALLASVVLAVVMALPRVLPAAGSGARRPARPGGAQASSAPACSAPASSAPAPAPVARAARVGSTAPQRIGSAAGRRHEVLV